MDEVTYRFQRESEKKLAEAAERCSGFFVVCPGTVGFSRSLYLPPDDTDD